jgi:molecular chaperone GrpE
MTKQTEPEKEQPTLPDPALLQEKCKALEEENKKLVEQLQRLSADYANYQKRTARQIAEAVAYEKRGLLRSWVSSLDNLEHALASLSGQNGPDALPKLVEGIRLVYEHMLAVLQSHGVRKMDPVGQPFSPGPHEALMTCAQPDREDNTVLEVHQSGYLLGEDVLRPAKVVVNKLPTAPEKTDQTQSSSGDNPMTGQKTEETTDSQES